MLKATHILKYVFAVIAAASLAALVSLDPLDCTPWQTVALVYAAVGVIGAASFAAYRFIEKQERANREYERCVNSRRAVRKFEK